jgi:hypothetical protein
LHDYSSKYLTAKDAKSAKEMRGDLPRNTRSTQKVKKRCSAYSLPFGVLRVFRGKKAFSLGVLGGSSKRLISGSLAKH